MYIYIYMVAPQKLVYLFSTKTGTVGKPVWFFVWGAIRSDGQQKKHVNRKMENPNRPNNQSDHIHEIPHLFSDGFRRRPSRRPTTN